MPPAPAVATWRPGPGARVRSWLGDWLVVAGWLAFLTVAGLLVPSGRTAAAPGAARSTADLVLTDLGIAAVTVLPYVVYLSLTETSRRRATLGKRWAGLVVADAHGGTPGRDQVWLRNLVKALPWQLAHLGVTRIVLDVQLPAAVVLQVLALALAAACMVPSLVGGRGVHDRLAGTRVELAGPRADAGAP
jgi:uncharacterized RDD family membrane protein YckC